MGLLHFHFSTVIPRSDGLELHIRMNRELGVLGPVKSNAISSGTLSGANVLTSMYFRKLHASWDILDIDNLGSSERDNSRMKSMGSMCPFRSHLLQLLSFR
jgi:hypothetical protein